MLFVYRCFRLLVCCLYIRTFIYKNVCPFDCTAVTVGEGLACNPVDHTSWVTVITPTDRPKSARNRGVIELLYIVSVHIQYQASIYTISLCCGHSWRVRLAKQETLTPPGHLVSPLVCRGP